MQVIDSKDLEFPCENRLIFDWLSFSSRIHKPADLMALIGMSDVPWEIMTSGNGYTHRHYFGGISISFAQDMTHVNGFFLLEMSGQGCRTFETYGNGDYEKLFSLVRLEACKPKTMQDVRLTRLDVAYDDLSGLLDIEVICEKTRMEHFVSRIHNYEAIYSNKGLSANFGSKGSNVFIRIYDKAMERGYTDGRHWIRCELQIRKENACGFVVKLQEHSLSDLYCSVLKNYLSFREPNDNDSNVRRWEESSFWSAFIDSAKPISIYEKPGVVYNLSACEKYVLTQPLGSIKTLIKVFGVDVFIDMINNSPMPKNPKYNRLVMMAKMDQVNRDEILGVRSIELESDTELEEYAEFVDDLRSEYDKIKAVHLSDERDRKVKQFYSRMNSDYMKQKREEVNRNYHPELYERESF